jgi:hypothetical protein
MVSLVSVRRAEQNENHGSIPQNIVLLEGSQYLPVCLSVRLLVFILERTMLG